MHILCHFVELRILNLSNLCKYEVAKFTYNYEHSKLPQKLLNILALVLILMVILHDIPLTIEELQQDGQLSLIPAILYLLSLQNVCTR